MVQADWHEDNSDYVHLLLSQFRGRAEALSPTKAVMLSKVVGNFGEPVTVKYEVFQRICQVIMCIELNRSYTVDDQKRFCDIAVYRF